MTATDNSIQALLAVKASDLLNQRSCYIERRLLEGADRLMVETDIYASTGLKGVLEKNVYEIPRWRAHPKSRFRIWLARRRYRRLA